MARMRQYGGQGNLDGKLTELQITGRTIAKKGFEKYRVCRFRIDALCIES